MLVGIFPEIDKAGGVQRICTHAAATLAEMAEAQGSFYTILALNDSKGEHSFEVGGFGFRYRGFGRDKGRFLIEALKVAREADSVLLGHPNLTPLTLPSKVLNNRASWYCLTYGIDVWERLSLLRRLSIRSQDRVLSISDYTTDQLVGQQGVPRSRVSYIPPAVDPTFVKAAKSARRGSQASSDQLTLLTVCRLATTERQKGVDTVIHTLPLLVEEFPELRYVVVGDGDDMPRLRALASELGVASHVVFAGEQRGDALLNHYAECDVFVMPSKKEGFGIVFLEAMAFGKPVIGGDYGGTPDVIEDAQTGFLVPYGDVDYLSDRIRMLLRNPELRTSFGEAGMLRLEQEFTFSIFRRRLRDILGSNSGRG